LILRGWRKKNQIEPQRTEKGKKKKGEVTAEDAEIAERRRRNSPKKRNRRD